MWNYPESRPSLDERPKIAPHGLFSVAAHLSVGEEFGGAATGGSVLPPPLRTSGTENKSIVSNFENETTVAVGFDQFKSQNIHLNMEQNHISIYRCTSERGVGAQSIHSTLPGWMDIVYVIASNILIVKWLRRWLVLLPEKIASIL